MRKECVRNFHLRLNPSFFSNFNPDHNPVALDDMFLFTVTYSSEVVNNLKNQTNNNSTHNPLFNY